MPVSTERMTNQERKSKNERRGSFLGFLIGVITWYMWKGLLVIPIRPLEYAIGVPLLSSAGAFLAYALFSDLSDMFIGRPIVFFGKPFMSFVFSYAIIIAGLDFLLAILTKTLPLRLPHREPFKLREPIKWLSS